VSTVRWNAELVAVGEALEEESASFVGLGDEAVDANAAFVAVNASLERVVAARCRNNDAAEAMSASPAHMRFDP
jgi:hypothetical protein